MSYLTAKDIKNWNQRFSSGGSSRHLNLHLSGGRLNFQEEADLELFVAEKLEKIYPSLRIISTQYLVNNQRCDILCYEVGSQRLVIIELKNESYRHLVSQLTRYFKHFLEAKPFSDVIDYTKPPLLIGIIPELHEDNLIDKSFSVLSENIKFNLFEIKQENSEKFFSITDESKKTISIKINSPSQETESLPIHLFNFTSGQLSSKEIENFVEFRSLMLSQPKAKEFVASRFNKVLYGIGTGERNRKIAEVVKSKNGMNLFLWLPTYQGKHFQSSIDRFAILLTTGAHLFSRESEVEWIVCTPNAIPYKDKPDPAKKKYGSNNRQGMAKWLKAHNYLSFVANSSNPSGTTYWMLREMLMNIVPPVDKEVWEQWKVFSQKTPTSLEWYIDLAVKTWNHEGTRRRRRIKVGNDSLDEEE